MESQEYNSITDNIEEEIVPLNEETEHIERNFPSLIMNTETAPLKESILFFLSAAGSTLGWTALLSNLVFYTDTLGVDSFLILNLAVYGPLLPITLLQTIFDSKFDQQFKSMKSFIFRGSVAFLTTFICLILLPWTSKSLKNVSITALFLGLSSAILHGMLKQMASFVYPSCGRLPAAVTAGMQASAVFVLIISIACDFDDYNSSRGMEKFFFANAAVLVVCWCSFYALLRSSRGVMKSMRRRDSLFENEDQYNLLESDGRPDITINNSGELPLSQLIRKSWPAYVTIFITVSSSMSLSSWFNRFQSEDAMNQGLPQVLFYTRLFADLLGRPATLYLSPKSIKYVLCGALLRVLTTPIFFVYSSTSLIPRNDLAITIGVFIFSFTSGYLVTLAYQLAPFLIHENERERNRTQQNSLLNVFFSVSVVLGLIITFIFRATL